MQETFASILNVLTIVGLYCNDLLNIGQAWLIEFASHINYNSFTVVLMVQALAILFYPALGQMGVIIAHNCLQYKKHKVKSIAVVVSMVAISVIISLVPYGAIWYFFNWQSMVAASFFSFAMDQLLSRVVVKDLAIDAASYYIINLDKRA